MEILSPLQSVVFDAFVLPPFIESHVDIATLKTAFMSEKQSQSFRKSGPRSTKHLKFCCGLYYSFGLPNSHQVQINASDSPEMITDIYLLGHPILQAIYVSPLQSKQGSHCLL